MAVISYSTTQAILQQTQVLLQYSASDPCLRLFLLDPVLASLLTPDMRTDRNHTKRLKLAKRLFHISRKDPKMTLLLPATVHGDMCERDNT